MRATYGLTALCLFAASPAQAEALQIAAPASAEDLAACMYRSLRAESPGQVRLTSLGRGVQEISREMSGVGSSVFMWRAEIRPAGRSASIVSAEVTRPLFGPDQFEREIRAAAQGCAGA